MLRRAQASRSEAARRRDSRASRALSCRNDRYTVLPAEPAPIPRGIVKEISDPGCMTWARRQQRRWSPRERAGDNRRFLRCPGGPGRRATKRGCRIHVLAQYRKLFTFLLAACCATAIAQPIPREGCPPGARYAPVPSVEGGVGQEPAAKRDACERHRRAAGPGYPGRRGPGLGYPRHRHYANPPVYPLPPRGTPTQ